MQIKHTEMCHIFSKTCTFKHRTATSTLNNPRQLKPNLLVKQFSGQSNQVSWPTVRRTLNCLHLKENCTWRDHEFTFNSCMLCRCPSQLDQEDYKTLQDDELQVKFVYSIPFFFWSNSRAIKTKELQFLIFLSAWASYAVSCQKCKTVSAIKLYEVSGSRE